MIREPHQRAVVLASRDSRPRAALLIDSDAAGLPMFRVTQLVHPALNFALKHYDAALANERFLLAIVTRMIDQCRRYFSRFSIR